MLARGSAQKKSRIFFLHNRNNTLGTHNLRKWTPPLILSPPCRNPQMTVPGPLAWARVSWSFTTLSSRSCSLCSGCLRLLLLPELDGRHAGNRKKVDSKSGKLLERFAFIFYSQMLRESMHLQPCTYTSYFQWGEWILCYLILTSDQLSEVYKLFQKKKTHFSACYQGSLNFMKLQLTTCWTQWINCENILLHKSTRSHLQHQHCFLPLWRCNNLL